MKYMLIIWKTRGQNGYLSKSWSLIQGIYNSINYLNKSIESIKYEKIFKQEKQQSHSRIP